MRSLTFIGLPLSTRSDNSGMADAVSTLREAGLITTLRQLGASFTDAGDVPLTKINTDTGPKNLANFTTFLQDTKRIQSAVAEVDPEGLLFALGGDCSICVGTLAGLKARIDGEAGVVWVDAHGDFNTPETTPSGYIGGMCLAMACGRGPELDEAIRDTGGLLREENVVHLASRSLDPAESRSMSSSPIKIYPVSVLHRDGVAATADAAISTLAERCDWILCHLDVDSLDPTIIPAVNFPEPNGLTLEETKAIVDSVKATRKLKLLELTAYNPGLDPARTTATKLIELTSNLLG